jgi:type IV secretory pathway VirB10-like protein
MAHERVRDAEALLRDGDARKGLNELERAQQDFKKTRDREGLELVLRAAETAGATLAEGDKAKLERITYAASQNIRELVSRGAGALPAETVSIPPRNALDAIGGGARAAIEHGLMPGEVVAVVVRGTGATAIVGTDRRAFIFKKGLLAGATFGHKLGSFAYESIVGVELHGGALTGAVVIHVPGAASVSTSYWQNAKDDAHKAYNAIPISRPYAEAQEGVSALRALISEHSSRRHPVAQPAVHAVTPPPPATPVAAPVAPPDVFEQLRKLAELRDAGIVTAEEFDAKKAELLSRL